jgi:hypothetical protein
MSVTLVDRSVSRFCTSQNGFASFGGFGIHELASESGGTSDTLVSQTLFHSQTTASALTTKQDATTSTSATNTALEIAFGDTTERTVGVSFTLCFERHKSETERQHRHKECAKFHGTNAPALPGWMWNRLSATPLGQSITEVAKEPSSLRLSTRILCQFSCSRLWSRVSCLSNFLNLVHFFKKLVLFLSPQNNRAFQPRNTPFLTSVC